MFKKIEKVWMTRSTYNALKRALETYLEDEATDAYISRVLKILPMQERRGWLIRNGGSFEIGDNKLQICRIFDRGTLCYEFYSGNEIFYSKGLNEVGYQTSDGLVFFDRKRIYIFLRKYATNISIKKLTMTDEFCCRYEKVVELFEKLVELTKLDVNFDAFLSGIYKILKAEITEDQYFVHIASAGGASLIAVDGVIIGGRDDDTGKCMVAGDVRLIPNDRIWKYL